MVATIRFKDHPEFTPNLTPKQIFQRGSFGGTYWRPIYSNVTHKHYKNQHKKYKCLKGLPDDQLTKDWDEYDAHLNLYQVKVGTTLEFWEHKHWISPLHPYGWVQWYCAFYDGQRGPDDERQIKRWSQTAGPNSRFRRALINQIKKKHGKFNDIAISPRIRQTQQHWAYVLTSHDFLK